MTSSQEDGTSSMEAILKDYIEQQLRDLGEDIDLGLADDLVLIGFDSIAYVRLVAFINERFGIKVPDIDVTVEQFGTVANIAAYLADHAAGQPAAGGGAS